MIVGTSVFWFGREAFGEKLGCRYQVEWVCKILME